MSRSIASIEPFFRFLCWVPMFPLCSKQLEILWRRTAMDGVEHVVFDVISCLYLWKVARDLPQTQRQSKNYSIFGCPANDLPRIHPQPSARWTRRPPTSLLHCRYFYVYCGVVFFVSFSCVFFVYSLIVFGFSRLLRFCIFWERQICTDF